MEILRESLEVVKNIQSFIGLVAFVLFIVLFVAWIFYKKTVSATQHDSFVLMKVLFKGILGLASLLIILYFSLLVLEKSGYFISIKPVVSIFKEKAHLGDNKFARIGGPSLPTVDDPLSQNTNEIIFYDKETESFKTSFGLPASVQMIASHYGPIFKKYNLKAWKYISVIESTNKYKRTYENASIQIDSSTVLIWIEDATYKGEGHFYSRLAAVARTKSLNLFSELKNIGYSPEGRRLLGATFSIRGLHGSRRPDQPDNIHLLVNHKIYPIPFKSIILRNEEEVSIHIDSSSFSIEPDKVTMFSIIVLPFQEKSPIPPPSYKHRLGPAHFRDVEVGDCKIELHFDKT